MVAGNIEGAADIVLVYPKTGVDVGSAITPPHSLLAVAAPLHARGCRITIIDQRVDADWRARLRRVVREGPVCIGVTCMVGTQIRFALEAARVVREVSDGSVPIVWGGPHPTTLPEQTLENPNVDIVCVGEGEATFSELVDAIVAHRPLAEVPGLAFKSGGRPIATPPRELVDVEQLSPVPWDLIDVEAYVRPDFYLKESPRTLDIGQTSRGCPFHCGFCSSACIRQRKWRGMSAERSVAMIVEAVRRFDLSGIWIRDDEFHVDRRRTVAICEGMIRNDLRIHWYTSGTRVDLFNRASADEVELLKRSGAVALKFGVESGSDRILQMIGKGVTSDDARAANLKAKRHGIVFGFSLMMGFPTETFEEIEQTIDLGQELVRSNPSAQLETIATYTPLPGTPLFELAIEHGLRPPQRLEQWIDWDFWEYDDEGHRIPWFDRRGRRRIGNIGYYHTIAYALPNLVDSVSQVWLRRLLQLLAVPLAHYARLRIRTKRFGFAPELALARFLRRRLLHRRGAHRPPDDRHKSLDGSGS